MKKTYFILLFLSLFTITTKAQTKKDGTTDKRYNTNKQNSPTPSTTTNSSARPVYSGQTHTTSHGGTYIGEQNAQTHKGGTYVNPKSNNNYGIHKTK